MAIARNLVADHFKSSTFRLEVTVGAMVDADEYEASSEDSVLGSMSNAALMRAVRRLAPHLQTCVTLRFLHGLSPARTARSMGMSEKEVKSLQCRAVRTLAALLAQDDEHDSTR